jgi:prohibitin 2
METFLHLKLEGANGTGADGVYARAIALQLTNIDLPSEYQQAVQNKQSAQENIALAQSQRTQNTTIATTGLLSARQQAQAILATAANAANVTLTQAKFQAEQILFSLATEAQVVAQVKAALNLSTNGIISYTANRLYEVVTDLKVAAGEPANLSRKGDL